jgi:small-conductance mechanosensitive channel
MASTDVISGFFQSINTSTILSSLGLLLLAAAAIRVTTFALTRLSELKILNVLGLNRITVKMLIPLVKFSFYFTTIYYILAFIFNIASNQLILFSGLLGAGLGFGLQNLFADVVGGLLIVAERTYQIGDKIHLGGYYGEVKDIGLRVTSLVTPDDTLVSVPNSSILQSPAANVNAGNLEMMVVIDMFIDSTSDASMAMNILREALITSPYIRLSEKHPYVILMKDFPFYKRIRAKGYANDFRYEFILETDVTNRAWHEFRRTGIMPPRMVMPESGIINETNKI